MAERQIKRMLLDARPLSFWTMSMFTYKIKGDWISSQRSIVLAELTAGNVSDGILIIIQYNVTHTCM